MVPTHTWLLQNRKEQSSRKLLAFLVSFISFTKLRSGLNRLPFHAFYLGLYSLHFCPHHLSPNIFLTYKYTLPVTQASCHDFLRRGRFLSFIFEYNLFTHPLWSYKIVLINYNMRFILKYLFLTIIAVFCFNFILPLNKYIKAE